jgi:hypothetical protein
VRFCKRRQSRSGHNLPQHERELVPELSLGWVTRFRQRHKIVNRVRYGEAGSVLATAEKGMRAFQTVAGEYLEEDIYNMDQMGLYWKMTPTRDFMTAEAAIGRKKEKARISVVVCVNSTGTDRVPLWSIRKAKTLRALRNVEVTAVGGV